MASLMQQMFFLYREATYNKFGRKIESVANGSHNGVPTLELYGHKKGNQGYVDDGTVVDFPGHLFASNKDREIALSYTSCRHAAPFVAEFLAACPPGLITKIEKVEHSTKGLKILSRWHDLPPAVDITALRPNYKLDHTVIKVTVRSSEEYAIDLAKAQFGHPEPILPWHLYETTRVETLYKTKNLVTYNILQVDEFSPRKLEEIRQNFAEEYASEENYDYMDRFLVLMNLWMMEWLVPRNTSLASIAIMPPEEFLKEQGELMRELHLHFGLDRHFLDYFRTAIGRELLMKYSSAAREQSSVGQQAFNNAMARRLEGRMTLCACH